MKFFHIENKHGVRVLSVAILAMAFVLFHTGASEAYDLQWNTSASFFTGIFNPYTKASINDISMDSDMMLDFRLKYHFLRDIALEVGAGSWRHHANFPAAHRIGNTLMPGKGSAKLYPSFASIIYYFPERRMRNLMGYVGFGGGWYRFRYEYDPDPVVKQGDVWFEKADDTVGFHLLGGIEYFPNKEFSFRGELRYDRADVSIDVDNATATPAAFVDLTGYSCSFGLTYYFREAKE